MVKKETTVIFKIKALYKDEEDTEITSDNFSANLKFLPVEEEEEDEEVVESVAEEAT